MDWDRLMPGHTSTDDPLRHRASMTAKEGSSFDLLDFSGPVGPGAANRPRDVTRIEALLAAAGHLDLKSTAGTTGVFGKRVESALRRAQRTVGVEADGVLNPNGPTLAALTKADRGGPRFADSVRTIQATIPRMPAEDFGALRRTAQAVLKTGTAGDVPKAAAESFVTGAKGKAEVIELIGLIADKNPQAADRLRRDVAERVGKDDRALLYSGELVRQLSDEQEEAEIKTREGKAPGGGDQPDPMGSSEPTSKLPETNGKKPNDPKKSNDCLNEEIDAKEAQEEVVRLNGEINWRRRWIEEIPREIAGIESGEIVPDPEKYGPDPMPTAPHLPFPPFPIKRPRLPLEIIFALIARARDRAAKEVVKRRAIADRQKEMEPLPNEIKELEKEKERAIRKEQERIKILEACSTRK